MTPLCDRRRLALALIAAVANAAYTTLAPILPLEADQRGISERWVSLVFLAFSIGSSVTPVLVARHLERVGTVKVTAGAMAGMSVLFWFLGNAFGIGSSEDADDAANGKIIGLLILLQFLMGACFSTISTGYYSLATMIFAEKESAMSSIEASLGIGYIVGPIVGSFLYYEIGYQYAYESVSLGMMAMALVTWKLIAPVLKCEAPDANDDELSTDLEAQTSYSSIESYDRASQRLPMDIAEEANDLQLPSTLSLLKYPAILFAATNILWINVSWTFIEPLLAKRLESFDVGTKQIGLIFSLSNMVYVPAVFLVQHIFRNSKRRHQIIALATALTPVAVLLTGSKHLSLVVFGIGLIGLLPTPVWIMLLPFMQDESTMLFPDPNKKRRLNDVTAGIYNCFMTLGQVAGYILSAVLGPHGFALTARVVASLILLQSALFFFCTIDPRKKKACE